MHKIGREVLFLETNDTVSRMGEGAMIRTKDGAILFAYTKYESNRHDHGTAQIAARCSYDEGEHWGEEFILLTRENDDINIMSVSLMRMRNGDLGMFYLRKWDKDGLVLCTPMLRRSEDEGKRWSEAIRCSDIDDYIVVNNDRVIRTESGRLLIPAAIHSAAVATGKIGPGVGYCFYSDDDGYTWQDTGLRQEMPLVGGQVQEPGLYQHESGRLWMYYRTKMGYQYQCFSEDDGMTWSALSCNTFFSSPASPMLIKRIHGKTLSVFNPIPAYTTREPSAPAGRSPYVLAVSDNDGVTHDGESFSGLYYLEDDLTNSYCYPTLLETKDGGCLISYYHSNGTPHFLNCAKVVKIDMSKL